MDKPVFTRFHKNYMTFEEFKECVHSEVKRCCTYEPYPYFNEEHWRTDEWQRILTNAYNRYSKSCKTETEWDLAVNVVTCEFDVWF